MYGEIFLSIIVPVYNTEKYLRECMDSIIQVTDVTYEIVCVNDGSKDNSLSILEEYCEKYDFVRVISQENAGLSEARNTGIRNAKGEYLLFLDSDDMLVNGAVDEISKKLQEDLPQILAYDTDCMYETEHLKNTEYKDEYYHRKKSYGTSIMGRTMFCDMIENNDYCDSACMMAISRSWLLQQGLFFKRGMIYEDCLFTFLCYMKAERISHINKSYMIYRIRQNSIMQSTMSFKNVEGRLESYCEVIRYLLQTDGEVRLQNALTKFAEFIYGNLEFAYGNVSVEEKEKANQLDGAKYLLLKGMRDIDAEQEETEISLYGKGFDEALKDSTGVVIYGAGKMGRFVYNYLKGKELGQKVVCFAVTNLSSAEKIDNVKVSSIADVEAGALILICARKDYQKEMYKTAKGCGHRNIILVDHRLEQYISLAK